MLRDDLVGLIEPILSSVGAYSRAPGTATKKPSDDRPPCLENPRPEEAESTLTENAASPFQAEPTYDQATRLHRVKFMFLAGFCRIRSDANAGVAPLQPSVCARVLKAIFRSTPGPVLF